MLCFFGMAVFYLQWCFSVDQACVPRRTDIARRASTATTISSPVSGIPEKHTCTETESETLVMLCRTNGFLFSDSESHLTQWNYSE